MFTVVWSYSAESKQADPLKSIGAVWVYMDLHTQLTLCSYCSLCAQIGPGASDTGLAQPSTPIVQSHGVVCTFCLYCGLPIGQGQGAFVCFYCF